MITQTVLQILTGLGTRLSPSQPTTPVYAAVMGLVANRVYLNHAPQEVDPTQTPYLVVWLVSANHLRGLAGRAGQERGVVAIGVYAGTPGDATILADTVGKFLDGFFGTAGPAPAAQVEGIFEDGAHDDFSPPVHGDEAGNPDQVLFFKVWQKE